MKTYQLRGESLAWAVLTALGKPAYVSKNKRVITAPYGTFNHRKGLPYFEPQYRGSQGLALIWKYKIAIEPWDSCYRWRAHINNEVEAFGDNPVEAAMKALVKHKLGDEVEIPKGLQ